MSRLHVANVLAVLAPLCLLTSALGVMATVELSSGEVGEDMVGHVLNGQRTELDVVRHMHQQLEAHPPQVLVLGSSFANTNLDPNEVASAVGVDPADVLVFSIPNSVSSHWFAVLQNRLYERGLTVPRVIVVSSLRSMLVTQPYTPVSHGNLVVHMEPTEPVLDRFVTRRHPAVERLLRNRLILRDKAVLSLGLLTSPGDAELSRTALSRVFHDSHLDHSTHRPLLLTDVGRDALLATTVDGLPTPDDSLIPEMLRLATAHGTQLLFVRTQNAPHTPIGRQDLVQPGTSERMDEMFADAGHIYLDMWAEPMKGIHFRDLKHMRPESARRCQRSRKPAGIRC